MDPLWRLSACSGPFCGTCCVSRGVRVGEPDVGSSLYTFACWCRVLLFGRCGVPCICAVQPQGLSPRKLHPVLRAERAEKDPFATGQKKKFFDV